MQVPPGKASTGTFASIASREQGIQQNMEALCNIIYAMPPIAFLELHAAVRTLLASRTCMVQPQAANGATLE